MTKQLAPWDQYIRDAAREPVELPMPDGDPIKVTMPSGSVVRAFNRSMREGDQDAAIIAMLGDEAGNRLLAATDDAPATVLKSILNDILKHFGMGSLGE